MTIKGQKAGAKKKTIHKPATAIKILNIFRENGTCKKIKPQRNGYYFSYLETASLGTLDTPNSESGSKCWY